MRKDIQGLRAVAVVAVLLFHFFPNRFSGGYVGVDIFFVISGFLITSHLIRRPPLSWGLLLDFWARRIKRLIPAATVVLIFTLVAIIIFLPETALQQSVYEIAAAAVYGENWILALNATDYLASQDAPSPVQHYWSLSVEEQFYIVWPIVIGATYIVAQKYSTVKKLTGLVMLIIFSVSLVYSMYLTKANPSAAYFVTGTRVWELAIGGIVALGAIRFKLPDRASRIMATSGLMMVVTSIAFFTKETPFPGYTALVPTLGVAFIILAATDSVQWLPRYVLGWKIVQFLGDISYSLYLWHWPIVVIAPFALNTEYLTLFQKIILIAITIVLSVLTKKYIEDPARSTWKLTSNNRRTFVYGAVSVAIVVGCALIVAELNQSRVELAQKTLNSAVKNNDPCLGAAALRNDYCSDIQGDKLLSTPSLAKKDRTIVYSDNCIVNVPTDKKTVCTYGKVGSSRKIALIGNSHAAHWQGLLDSVATENNWQLDTYLITRCYTVLRPISFEMQELKKNCGTWNEWAVNAIIAGDYSLVILSNSSKIDLEGIAQEKQNDEKKKAYADVMSRFVASDKKVLVLRDVPGLLNNAPDCIAKLKDPSKCANERKKVISNDPLYSSALEQKSKDIIPLDLSNRFCDESFCYAVIGGLIVYFDGGHITDDYARTLAPDILPKLEELMKH